MRKLTGAVFQSLDGVMQAPGGPEEDPTNHFKYGGWSFHFWDESLEKPFGEVIEADYDLLLGKRTYDIFSAYWPHNQEMEIGAKFQRINKYVLTHSDEPLGWEHSHKLSGDTAEAVTELKRSEGRDLLIQGSSTLYAPLLAAGLIDRLILMIFPVMLGTGKSISMPTKTPVVGDRSTWPNGGSLVPTCSEARTRTLSGSARVTSSAPTSRLLPVAR